MGWSDPPCGKKQKHAVATYIIGSHSMIFVDARQTQYITIEGSSPVEVSNLGMRGS